MAARNHVRSISLPSRSHPCSSRVEEELTKLKTWEGSSISTSGSICIGLSGLEDLYKCVDDVLNMASTQEVVSRIQREKRCLDGLLDDGSVRLLDVCSIARDMMMRLKEQVQGLQSALRRRKGDSSCESAVADYTCFRKKMKKDAKKMMSSLKQMDSKLVGASVVLVSDQDGHLSAVIRMLREVNLMNISIFQSLLVFLCKPSASKTKQSKWSLVSKLMQRGSVAVSCEELNEKNVNEFENVDAVLFESNNKFDSEKTRIAQKRLGALEIGIEDVENCLERVFRRLIKTRTSLLNIISQ